MRTVYRTRQQRNDIRLAERNCNEQIAVFGARFARDFFTRFARDFFTRIEWRKCFGKISGCSTVPHFVPG